MSAARRRKKRAAGEAELRSLLTADEAAAAAGGRDPKPKVAGQEVALDEHGLPLGSTIGARLDGLRKGAGIPTREEAAAAKDPPPVEQRLALGLCCLSLMAVASYASQLMSGILEKDGESEPLRGMGVWSGRRSRRCRAPLRLRQVSCNAPVSARGGLTSLLRLRQDPMDHTH